SLLVLLPPSRTLLLSFTIILPPPNPTPFPYTTLFRSLYRRSAARPIAFLPQQSVRIRSGILLYCGYAIAFVSLSALPYRILPPCGGRNERFGRVACGCLPVWKFS